MLCDQDRLLHLRRPAVVLRDPGPAVLQLPDPPSALTDHRLHGEDHAGPHDTHDIVETMVNVRGAVQEGTETVAQELWYCGKILLLGMFVYGMTDTSHYSTYKPRLLTAQQYSEAYLARNYQYQH